MRIAVFVLAFLVSVADASEGEVDGKALICAETTKLTQFPDWPVYGYRFVNGEVFLDRLSYDSQSAHIWTTKPGKYITAFDRILWPIPSPTSQLNRQTLNLELHFPKITDYPKHTFKCRVVDTPDAYDLELRKQIIDYNKELGRRLKKNKI